jgi:MFS transporter, Spinster family, sphingosine-1-phosphate transporter
MTEDAITPTPPAKPDERLSAEPPPAAAPHGLFAGSALRSGLVPGATTALVLLLFINMFNYIDRYILAAVEPEIEKALFPNGGEYVEFWMGLLFSMFMIAFMLLAPLFGLLADRMSRWNLMALGVAVWSLASGASGLTTAYLAMLLTRAAVGAGEAAYGPAAPAVLSDLYPVQRRGAVLAYFYAAIPAGSALGYVIGGLMLWLTHDWRWAFYVVAPPGLLLALLCLFMREPPRGQSDPATRPHAASWRDYLIILRTPSFVLCTLGYTATTFTVGGLAAWMPKYFSVNRGEGDLGPVGMIFGGILAASGLLATLAGGWAGDALRRRFPGSYFLVSGLGMLVAFPLMLAVLVAPYPWDYVLVFVTVFWLFFNTGPVNTIVANVTHPAVRASAFALVILVIHLFGDVASPPIIGFIAGQARATAEAAPQPSWWTSFLASRGGWDFSFCVVSLMILLAGVLWLWGAKYLERDTALAPTRTVSPAPEPEAP